KLARSGGDYEVPAGETIVSVLQRHGIAVRTSCELGYCGACLTPYLAGEPDHRDQILEENSRRRYVLICCARSKTPVLEQDHRRDAAHPIFRRGLRVLVDVDLGYGQLTGHVGREIFEERADRAAGA